MFKPPFSLPYAETHYKFKLLWSPLHKKWPEVFIDGPSICLPDSDPIFYLIIKDADYFPIKVKSVDVQIHAQQEKTQQSFSFDFLVNENLLFFPLALKLPKQPDTYTLHTKIVIEKNGKLQIIFNGNFPSLQTPSLQVQRLAHALPYPEHWVAGELHCHSDYSNDPVEYGAPLKVLQEAGAALGLGFVCCTDHSYDFYYRKDQYMQPTDPFKNFQNYRQEALQLNETKQEHFPTLIPGEEVSCGNSRGENVHLLVMGHPEFIPGHGDGGRRWFNNKPDLKIEEVLERIGKIPAFAAHPRVKVSRLEQMIFRRGMWHAQDLQTKEKTRSVTGLQFWNGHRGIDFSHGRALWVSELLKGNRYLPIGSSDAHGDLNQNIGVKMPMFSLYHSRKHVLGSVRTVVKTENKSIEGYQKAINNGDICITDGPVISLKTEANKIKIAAHSSPDFGELQKIHLFMGKLGGSQESIEKTWELRSGAYHIEREHALNTGLYYRAEAWTSEKKLAISAPVYLN